MIMYHLGFVILFNFWLKLMTLFCVAVTDAKWARYPVRKYKHVFLTGKYGRSLWQPCYTDFRFFANSIVLLKLKLMTRWDTDFCCTPIADKLIGAWRKWKLLIKGENQTLQKKKTLNKQIFFYFKNVHFCS